MSESSSDESPAASRFNIRYSNLADFLIGFSCLLICIVKFRDYTALSLAQSSDLCWLIRSGDWILSHWQIPDKNIFCWWQPELKPVSYQWLFEVFSSLMNRSIDIWGIGLISNLCAGAFLFWLLPKQWLSRGLPFSLTFLVLTLVPSRYWHFPRPQTAGCIFLYILISILLKFRDDKRSKEIYLLPLLMLLWVNIHLTWLLGWLITSIVFTACFIRNKTDKELRKTLIYVYAAIHLLLPLTPSGINSVVEHFFSFTNGNQYLKVYECLPSYATPDMVPFLFYCALAILLLVPSRKFIPLEYLLVSAFTLGLGILTNRFEPLTVIVSWPFAGEALATLLQKSKFSSLMTTAQALGNYWLRITGGFLAAVLISSVVWFLQCPNKQSALANLIPVDYEILGFPEKRQKTRVFNDPMLGNWMIYLEINKPMVCNRFDMYKASDIAQISDCLSGKKGFWQEYLDKQQIESILIPRTDPLAKRLDQPSSGWKLVAHDLIVTYWERSPKEAQAIQQTESQTQAIPEKIESKK